MKHYIFCLIILGLGCFFAPPAYAQMDCVPHYEMINNMHDPLMGAFNLWDTVYGSPDSAERFRSAVPLMNGNTLAAGESIPKIGDGIQLVLAEIDHRGRVVWEKIYNIPNLQNIVKILNRDNGVFVLGEVEDGTQSQPWTGLFDLNGVLQTQNTLTIGKDSNHPEDVIHLDNSDEYLMTATAETPKNDFYTQIYHLGPDGKILSSRAYRAGPNNRINALTSLGHGSYGGAGMSQSDTGQEQGWVTAFDAKGSILWQRPYAYGSAAKLMNIASYENGQIIVSGDMTPDGEKYKNGWAMMLDAGSGDIKWQRRYRSGASWSAQGLLTDDDKISALFDTAATRDDKQDYARLLTINGDGVLLDDKGYFNGVGARSTQLVEGKSGARIIVGNTDTVYTLKKPDTVLTKTDAEKPLAPDDMRHNVDGWLVAGQDAAIIPDQCNAPPEKSDKRKIK